MLETKKRRILVLCAGQFMRITCVQHILLVFEMSGIRKESLLLNLDLTFIFSISVYKSIKI